MSNIGCVYEQSNIFFKDNKILSEKSAKHFLVDDTVYSPTFKEFLITDNIYNWSSNKMSNLSISESRISSVFEYKHPKLIWFNDEEWAKFSLEQPILVKRNQTFRFLTTAMIEVGDLLTRYVKETGKYTEHRVESINTKDGDFTTYNFYVDPYKLFLVNGLIVASK